MNARSKARLVDYSDTEDETESDVLSGPSSTGPQDKDGFAQIVLGLQQQYTDEVRVLQSRQEATDRDMVLYMEQVNKRLQRQDNVIVSIIKKVFGVQPLDPVVRDFTQQAGNTDGCEKGAALPSPSPTPPALVQRRDVPPSERKSTQSSSVIQTAKPPVASEVQEQQSTAAEASPPSVRSTGKKAPRPRPVAASRRPYQPPRRPKRKDGGVDGSEDLRGEASEMEPGEAPGVRPHKVEQVADLAVDGSIVRREKSRQKVLSTRDAINPYDDPKYFSPLTIIDDDGVGRPIFKFYPHPLTVEEQWAEYRYGLHGQEPVELLEKKYRAKWRNGTYGRSWFTRRKAFWDKMKGLLAQGHTEAEALALLRDLGNGSVPTVVAILCKERGEGTRPGRQKSRDCSVGDYSVCGSKHPRDDSSNEEESVLSESEADEIPRATRPNRLRLRKRLVVSMDTMDGVVEPRSAVNYGQEADGLDEK
ncbi:hypothetical protein CORC01_13410 [Colletotrichum orchidophilum]|uniref:Transcription activator GCR1-like domain-containing protein n=1 Tax=Colletotrichum orchidophilum TaxID=1209926 RepID=A0A1G4AQC1_9PEZI|nr:uncharacterized protein CORC01_13410 [Colletotrichum orchidophilum]OHE91295.1 hypothetical protein CORC01_13410 [Colletotrichum orchidophilum]